MFEVCDVYDTLAILGIWDQHIDASRGPSSSHVSDLSLVAADGDHPGTGLIWQLP